MNLTKKSVYVRLKGHELRELPGYSFTIEGLEFNVHKSHTGSGWRVTEPRTGLMVVSGNTRKSALAMFEEMFNFKGKETIERLINKNIELIETKYSNKKVG